MSRHLFGAIGLLAFCGASAAQAQCDPVKFLVQDIDKVNWTRDLRTAFYMSASQEQYDASNKGGNTSGDYFGIKGSLSYAQAKESARKEAELMGFAQSDQQNLNLISQRLSRIGAEAYGKCLESIL
jgi:hypothetical protein